jgi:hypothetical protein
MGKYQHTSYGFDCISFIGESDSEILFRKEPLLGKDKKDTSVSPYMPGRLRQNLATWRRTTQDSDEASELVAPQSGQYCTN